MISKTIGGGNVNVVLADSLVLIYFLYMREDYGENLEKLLWLRKGMVSRIEGCS